jgi:tetratricopeptide (TPR) repeat protein
VLDLKMRCLDHLLSEMEALVHLFAEETDGQVVEKAAQATRDLGDLGLCSDGAKLSKVVSLPQEPERRQRVAELSLVLDRAAAQWRTGKYSDALATLEPSLEEIDGLDYLPVAARAYGQLGYLYESLGKMDQSAVQLRRSIELAAKAGDDYMLAQHENFLFFVVGFHLRRFEAAAEMSPLVRAAVARAGDPSDLLGGYRENLGTILSAKGDYENARKELENALELGTRGHGENNPTLAATLGALGETETALGRYDSALVHLRRAHEITLRAQGANHPRLAVSLLSIANLEYAMQDYAAAEKSYEKALAAVIRGFGENHPYVGVIYNNLGDTARNLGQHGKAIERYEKALGTFETTVGGDHAFAGHSSLGLGEAELELGRLDRAEAALSRADTILNQKGDAQVQGQVGFAWARLLWAKGQKPAALAMAEEARKRLAGSGASGAKDAAALTAWLAQKKAR